jgi:hypothetical protein
MRGNPFAVASAVAATQPGSVTVPISQKRMSEIETELAVIVRELDRIEKARAKRPEQPAVQCPWAPPLLLDLEK